MKPLKIVKDNNPLLRKVSQEVALPLSSEDRSTILNMLNYLKLTQDEEYRNEYPKVREGVGLAAPQIGILKKMLVIHFTDGDGREITHALVNPKIISTSVRKTYLQNGEGCLSVDNAHEGNVLRAYKIRVSAYDVLKNDNVEIVAEGFESVVLQHEIDHLSGILFYDHINPMNPKYAPDDAIIL